MLNKYNFFCYLLGLIFTCLMYDYKKLPIHVATVKALRSLKLLAFPTLVQNLLNNLAYKQHINQLDINDPFVFISHKYYMAKRLTTVERIRAAASHYQHESSAFDNTYLDVIGSKKLVVWRDEFEEDTFDIKLEHGNDVLYQGASSLVFYQNNERICVISFSVVPQDIFHPSSEKNALSDEKNMILITRKQPTQNYSYQKVFNKVFDRTTPAHLCMAALSGYAKTFGFNRAVGISAKSHPSIEPAYLNAFEKAYDMFWESMHGEKLSPYGFVFKLPLELSDLDSMDAKSRKRAIARREHANKVSES